MTVIKRILYHKSSKDNECNLREIYKMVNRPQTRIVKRKVRSRKKLFVSLTVVLAAFLMVIGYGIHLYIKAEQAVSGAYESDGREKSDYRDSLVDPKFDNVSILIMGVDVSNTRGKESVARTDALMLATLNKDEKSVKLVSIPRDSKVYIPEVGYEDRINHAHAFGDLSETSTGIRSTIETVEELFEIPVDYYVKVNFEAFIDVVNAIDGITVDVPYEFKEQNSKDKANAIHLLPGIQQLDGEEALALARTRKLDNDVERGKRQQEIIKAIIDKTVSVNSILKFDDIIPAVGDNMSTNMLFSELKSFISYGTSGTNLDIETISLSGEDLWLYEPRKKYYWKIDDFVLDETKQKLQQHLDITPRNRTFTGSSSTENASQ